MKTKSKIAFFTFILIFLLGVKGAKAHDEFTKLIKKEYAINQDAQITVNNRFGKIECTDWEKNAVSFEVKITVTAANQEEANKMFDRINIDFLDSPSQVSANTTIKETRFHGKSNFSIDYKINIPVTVNLDLTNKFGDIFLNELQGKCRINIGYGDLEINKLDNSDNLLDIQFGDAKVKWIKGAVVILKYSEMDLDYAGSLRLNSKFSDLVARKIISLNVDLEGGKLNMDNSSAIDSRSKFSDLEIQRVEQSINLDIQYGSCEIHEMPAEYPDIKIVNKYGDVSITLNNKAKYILDADLKFCDLDFPEENAKINFRSVSPTKNSYRGVVGGKDSPSGNIFIRSEFGNVSLK
ncbi:MAG: DUF4097 family beta strand repeat-containing protein [Bacteroidales bacterium]|nr:DUF4097 family beta strand repeat-containing protein [Bacteroidales bacterium]MDD4603837.1 DUF4097 family beta strand repeat-containing protein [Bacteroidales bacterium]